MSAILDGVVKGHTKLIKLQQQIEQMHRELGEGEPSEALLERLSTAEEQFRQLGGYQLEAEAKSILAGLGFKESDFHRPLSDFSGGWRMRVYLARLLLQQPDLLLLDEPTNHLDIESLEWLENYLKSFPGSIVTVSHDRFFIDRIADEICALEQGSLITYPGNYEQYLAQKAMREELLRKKWEEQQAERQRIQRFVDRFRYKATKAAQVQSRIKQLEKLEEVELPEPPPTISFSIKVETQSYKDVLHMRDVWFRYDEPWVLKDINLSLYRGDKVALVGVNGAGKTTLTKLIFGQLKPQKGLVEIGERVIMGYYAQHQVDALNLQNTILEEVASTAADAHRPKLRDILGIFQFSGDDVEKPISVLSGGEKARVSLAKILLSPVNFLIMDEPTNHLDITSQAALEKALKEYNGTLLLISHDRYFLDNLVQRVFELKDGKLKQFEGRYTDYLEKRKQQNEQQQSIAGDNKTKPVDKSEKGYKSKEQKRKEAEARQAISKSRQQLQKQIDACEKNLEQLEAEKSGIEAEMANPATYQDGQRVAALQKRYAEVKETIDKTLEEWEELTGQMEALLEKLNQL
jgi:ATP-binding cassette subfamily F protein 3